MKYVKIKDSWNREEVIDLIKTALYVSNELVTYYPDGTVQDLIVEKQPGNIGLEQWIKENL